MSNSNKRASSQFGGPPFTSEDSYSPIQGGLDGMDSLADELAGAWDDDEGEGQSDFNVSRLDESIMSEDRGLERDSGIDVSSPADKSTKENTSPKGNKHPRSPQARKHSRKHSAYDGSEYGDLSDSELPTDISSGLQAVMNDVEGLSKESGNGEDDRIFNRTMKELQDLGGQAGVESGTSRLITSHIALSTHLSHQTRALQTLTYALLNPLLPPPDESQIDDIIPLIDSSIAMIPQPTLSALSAIANLSNTSREVISTLNYLSDSLHMSRQITTTATRRLKGSRELVAEMRRENTARDDGMRWIETGKWEARLARRECASVCKDVVGGFEDVCNDWRAKLVKQAEVGAA